MRRTYWKVLLFNVVAICALLEGGVRAYYAITGAVPPHSDRSVANEWQWVSARLGDGKTDFTSEFVHDPYTGWKNAPNLDVPPKDGYGSIQTNSAGMRNHREFPLVRPADAPGRRLLIVGDSYSFGMGISNEDTYAYRLAELLPDWDIMNLSVNGTGTDQHYLMYRNYGEAYRPDIVLLGFFMRDFNRNTDSFRIYAKPMYLPREDGGVVLTNSPVPAPRVVLDEYRSGRKKIGGWHYSYVLAMLGNVLDERRKKDQSEGSLPRRVLSGIMEQFADRVRANGSIPVWVNFPTRDIEHRDVSRYHDVNEFSMREARRLGMLTVDLAPVFRAYLRENPDVETLWRPSEVGGHNSALAQRLVAETLYRAFAEAGLLQPRD